MLPKAARVDAAGDPEAVGVCADRVRDPPFAQETLRSVSRRPARSVGQRPAPASCTGTPGNEWAIALNTPRASTWFRSVHGDLAAAAQPADRYEGYRRHKLGEITGPARRSGRHLFPYWEGLELESSAALASVTPAQMPVPPTVGRRSVTPDGPVTTGLIHRAAKTRQEPSLCIAKAARQLRNLTCRSGWRAYHGGLPSNLHQQNRDHWCNPSSYETVQQNSLRTNAMESRTRLSLEPFSIHLEQEVLADLRARIHETRWPEPAPGSAWQQGTGLEHLRDILTYWADRFEWRAQGHELNAFEHFLPTLTASTSKTSKHRWV